MAQRPSPILSSLPLSSSKQTNSTLEFQIFSHSSWSHVNEKATWRYMCPEFLDKLAPSPIWGQSLGLAVTARRVWALLFQDGPMYQGNIREWIPDQQFRRGIIVFYIWDIYPDFSPANVYFSVSHKQKLSMNLKVGGHLWVWVNCFTVKIN